MLLTTVVFPIKVPKILIFSALLPSPFFLILRKNMAKYGILFLRKNEGKRHGFTKRILKKEVVEYLIPEEEVCPKCKSSLNVIGKEVIRTEVEFVPAKLLVKQIVRQVAKCSCCGQKDSEQKTPTFVKAQIPKSPLPHSFSTPSLIGQVLHQKFSLGLPFERQEKDWYYLGRIWLTGPSVAVRSGFFPFMKESMKSY